MPDPNPPTPNIAGGQVVATPSVLTAAVLQGIGLATVAVVAIGLVRARWGVDPVEEAQRILRRAGGAGE